jgi:hypothetical protein
MRPEETSLIDLDLYLEELSAETVPAQLAGACAATIATAGSFFCAGSTGSSIFTTTTFSCG